MGAMPSEFGAAVDAMRLAYDRNVRSWPSVNIVQSLIDRGWTPDVLDLVGVCARHAVARDTYIARIHTGGLAVSSDQQEAAAIALAHRLVGALKRWSAERNHVRSIVAWLPVIAADRNDPYPLLVPSGPGRVGSRRKVWTQFIGYELAPLAYAAGLSLAEARHAASAEALDAGNLRALAALRGFVLPAVPADR